MIKIHSCSPLSRVKDCQEPKYFTQKQLSVLLISGFQVKLIGRVHKSCVVDANVDVILFAVLGLLVIEEDSFRFVVGFIVVIAQGAGEDCQTIRVLIFYKLIEVIKPNPEHFQQSQTQAN